MAVDPPPPALRTRRPGWRDPRLWMGVVIVAASVLVGARVLGAADDTVAMWAVGSDVAVGDQLDPEDLVPVRVRFADVATGDRYFRTDAELPAELTALRALGADELLPRDAIGDTAEGGSAEISVEVPPTQLAPSIGPGSVVDVYLVDVGRGGGTDGGEGAGVPALEGVRVVDVPAAADTFAPSGAQQVVLAVPEDAVSRFYARLEAMSTPEIRLVRRS